ncbi:hypothetical protein PCE1_001794 [Barthelona sp. PCE]
MKSGDFLKSFETAYECIWDKRCYYMPLYHAKAVKYAIFNVTNESLLEFDRIVQLNIKCNQYFLLNRTTIHIDNNRKHSIYIFNENDCQPTLLHEFTQNLDHLFFLNDFAIYERRRKMYGLHYTEENIRQGIFEEIEVFDKHDIPVVSRRTHSVVFFFNTLFGNPRTMVFYIEDGMIKKFDLAEIFPQLLQIEHTNYFDIWHLSVETRSIIIEAKINGMFCIITIQNQELTICYMDLDCGFSIRKPFSLEFDHTSDLTRLYSVSNNRVLLNKEFFPRDHVLFTLMKYNFAFSLSFGAVFSSEHHLVVLNFDDNVTHFSNYSFMLEKIHRAEYRVGFSSNVIGLNIDRWSKYRGHCLYDCSMFDVLDCIPHFQTMLEADGDVHAVLENGNLFFSFVDVNNRRRVFAYCNSKGEDVREEFQLECERGVLQYFDEDNFIYKARFFGDYDGLGVIHYERVNGEWKCSSFNQGAAGVSLGGVVIPTSEKSAGAFFSLLTNNVALFQYGIYRVSNTEAPQVLVCFKEEGFDELINLDLVGFIQKHFHFMDSVLSFFIIDCEKHRFVRRRFHIGIDRVLDREVLDVSIIDYFMSARIIDVTEKVKRPEDIFEQKRENNELFGALAFGAAPQANNRFGAGFGAR